MISRFGLLILLAFIPMHFHSCATKRVTNDYVKDLGLFSLNTLYKEDLKKIQENQKRVLLIITNDLHNNFTQKKVTYFDQNSNSYKEMVLGGKETYLKYISKIKSKYQGQVVLIDAGNFSDLERTPKDAPTFFNELKYDFVALSKNEFSINFTYKNYYISQLNKILKQFNSKTGLHNITTFNTKNKELDINQNSIIEVNGIKIGLISVIQPEFAFDIKKENINGLVFEHFNKTITQKQEQFEEKGVNFNLLIASTNQTCHQKPAFEIKSKKVVNPNHEKNCDTNSYLHQQLTLLPENNLNLIVGSGTGDLIFNRINKVPMVQNPSGGTHFTLIDLVFDENNNYLEKESQIYRPVKICHTLFNDEGCEINPNIKSSTKENTLTFLSEQI